MNKSQCTSEHVIMHKFQVDKSRHGTTLGVGHFVTKRAIHNEIRHTSLVINLLLEKKKETKKWSKEHRRPTKRGENMIEDEQWRT